MRPTLPRSSDLWAGADLKRARQALGMSTADLGDALGLGGGNRKAASDAVRRLERDHPSRPITQHHIDAVLELVADRFDRG